MVATVLWACAFAAWAGFFFLVIWPFLKGRLPTDRYHEHLRSPEWAAVRARLEAKRRGRRSAVSGAASGLQTHHWTYVNLGYESTWQLVKVTDAEHKRIHTWSEWVFSSRTRGLAATTALVVGAGKIRQLPRRLVRPHRRTTSVTPKIPGAVSDGDWLLLPDGRIYQRTGTDWQDIS